MDAGESNFGVAARRASITKQQKEHKDIVCQPTLPLALS